MKRDLEKDRAWRQRGVENWERNKRQRPSRAKRRKTIPRAARRLVFARSGGRCIVCLGPAQQCHHVLDAQMFPELELATANLVALCVHCHAQHTAAARRIKRSELPACALKLALRSGGRALAHIDRVYPPDEGGMPQVEVEPLVRSNEEAPATSRRPGARHQESEPPDATAA